MPISNKGSSKPYTYTFWKINFFCVVTILLMHLISKEVVKLLEFLLRFRDILVPNIVSEADQLD
jgi:hypothetical protein